MIDSYEEKSDLVVIGSDSVNDFIARASAKDWIDTSSIRCGMDDYALRLVEKDGRTSFSRRTAAGAVRSTQCRITLRTVIGHTDSLPLKGLNICEKPGSEYRGLKYFARRGLHRYPLAAGVLETGDRLDGQTASELLHAARRYGRRVSAHLPGDSELSGHDRKAAGSGRRIRRHSLYRPLEYRNVLRRKLLPEREAYFRGADNADETLSIIDAICKLSVVMAGVLSCHKELTRHAMLKGLEAV